jgi:hypothetical protein
MPTTIPTRLECQPVSARGLVFYTHFDCWNDAGQSDDSTCPAPLWGERSARAVNLVWKLMVQAYALTGHPKYLHAGDSYLTLGQSRFFALLAKDFVQDGYHVYHSDICFEVYDPKQCDRAPA